MVRLPPISRVAFMALVVSSTIIGCSDDDGAGPVQAPSETSGSQGLDIPPDAFEEPERIFAPRFEAVGMELTRASMADLDEGPHLQLYIEPPGAFSTEEYVDSIVPTTAAVVPFIFEEWEDLASFDVCQEPPPGVDDSVAPEQVTVVALTREQAAEVAWPDPSLAELMAAVRGAAFGEVRGNDDVEASAGFREAQEGSG